MIRKLGPDDLDAFKALWLDGLQRFPFAFLLTFEEATAVADAQILSGLKAGVHWGVFEAAELIAIGSMRQGGPVRMRHMADVGPFYVAPGAQGAGVGGALLGVMIADAKARGLLQLELCVDAQNDKAVRLYEAAGFKIFGTRPRSVVVDGVARDDHLMMLQLDQNKPV